MSNIQYSSEELAFLKAYSLKKPSSVAHELESIYDSLVSHDYDLGWDDDNDSDYIIDPILVDISKEAKLDLWSLFKNKLPSCYTDFSHACLIMNPGSFIRITEMGATNDILDNEPDIMAFFDDTCAICEKEKSYRYDDDYFLFLLDACIQVYNNLVLRKISASPHNFRSLQLLSLYFCYKMNWTYYYYDISYSKALQVLWSSIPDPLLTQTDFNRVCDSIDPEIMHEVIKAWCWYSKLVRNGVETPEKCPRSLKHLSRIAIRLKLKESIQLPDGIEELNIPESLKAYLNLRDLNEINFLQATA